MIPEESVAYALAAWQRFDDHVPPGLLRAVAGAFVLVAASDGELTKAEADRFLETLASKADVFPRIDFDELSQAFGDLSEVMLSDPEDGTRLALSCVARAKGVAKHAELVMGAAEIAASADGRIKSVEKSVLRDIRVALGLAGSAA